jgi:hypothetical protein
MKMASGNRKLVCYRVWRVSHLKRISRPQAKWLEAVQFPENAVQKKGNSGFF